MANQMQVNENENACFERPLSPILSANSKITRKFILARKRQSRSRVKLTDRFDQGRVKDPEKGPKVLGNQAVTLSETIDTEEPKCEEKDEHLFKTPESPVVKRSKKNRNVGECLGFKTAGGKNIDICVSREIIEKSKILFDDILNPNSGLSRSNKHSFLRKQKAGNVSKSVDSLPNLDNQKPLGNVERPTNINLTLDLLNTHLFSDFTLTEDKLNQERITTINKEKSFKGFNLEDIDASRKKLQLFRQAVLTNSKFRGEDKPKILSVSPSSAEQNYSLKEIKCRNSFHLDSKKAQFPSSGGNFKNDEEILSTQETNQLFSDFALTEDQILENNYSKDNSIEENFKGFEEKIIEESRIKSDEFIILFDEYCDNEETLRPVEKIDNCPITSRNKSTLSKIHSSFSREPIFSQQGSLPLTGFRTAAGIPIVPTESTLRKAEQMFRSINSDCSLDMPRQEQSTTCRTESVTGLSANTSDDVEIRLKPVGNTQYADAYQNAKLKTEISGGTNVNLPNTEDLHFNNYTKKSFYMKENASYAGFTTAAGCKVSLSEGSLNKAKMIFENIDGDSLGVDICEERNSSTSMFKSLGGDHNKPSMSFRTAAGNALKFSESALIEAKRIFESIGCSIVEEKTAMNSREAAFSREENAFDDSHGSSNASSIINSLTGGENSTPSGATQASRKRRLGMPSCKPLKIPKHKLEKAMRIFDDIKAPMMSPRGSNQPSIYNSTPLKDCQVADIDSDITPIKVTRTISAKLAETEKGEVDNDKVVMCEWTGGNIDTWHDTLEEERKKLELKLAIISERKKALSTQKQLLDNVSEDYTKQRIGVLYGKKLSSRKVALQNFLKINNASKKKFNITPRNAEFLHFDFTHDNITTILTSDGACVVPNAQDLVGLSEIEIAFKTMRGVDSKLIPRGWIRNHFKWIVWKLAGYEHFAANMPDSLALENVVQQLKYRYDREIDRAERPALRKILEKDDASQKRIVLCVSDTFDSRNKFEIELTDGWYSIRTRLDEPLWQQVIKGKIQVGTKLVICGAELLNCEGCHPLEATDLVRLKINYNSTRRAKWYTKLGYQRRSEPFPIKLGFILPNGGTVGCINVHIARVYPIKYMEKQNNLNVWRNRKAEEIRAREWENKGRFNIERVNEFIKKDCELSGTSREKNAATNISESEIRSIDCPETLYNLCQSSKDPERLEGILSHSQKRSIVEYRQQVLFEQQQELSRKMADSIDRLQNQRRDVTPVLQICVVDVFQEKSNILQIWKPTETHLDIIKESSVFYVYNVVPKKNGSLYATTRTRFQQSNPSQITEYKRTLFPISRAVESSSRPLFDEFDTVGVVVAFSVNTCDQNLWLADPSGRLLFIKVFEGPKNCLLLDKVKVGQVTAASNLIFRESKMEFGEAVANHLTIISCYPQHEHLREGIDVLSKELPKDLTTFLQECDKKIACYVCEVNIIKDCQSSFSNSLVKNNSLVPSDFFDESSDLLFSMLSFDELE